MYPSKFKNTYKHWLDNIRDWPISRQLWWGQQIPAFKCWSNSKPNDYKWIAANNLNEALEKAKIHFNKSSSRTFF